MRDDAAQLLDQHDKFDAIVHTTGMLMMREERTENRLHPMFAIQSVRDDRWSGAIYWPRPGNLDVREPIPVAPASPPRPSADPPRS